MYSGDKDLLSVQPHLPYGTTTLANIEIVCGQHSQLSVTSLGGQMYSHGLLGHVYTVHDLSIWQEGITMNHQVTGKQPKLYGLQKNETNLLSLLDPDVVADIMAEAVDDDESTLPDLDPDFNETVASSQYPILQDIVDELVLQNPEKWTGTTIEDIFPEVLQMGNYSTMHVPLKICRQYPGQWKAILVDVGSLQSSTSGKMST